MRHNANHNLRFTNILRIQLTGEDYRFGKAIYTSTGTLENPIWQTWLFCYLQYGLLHPMCLRNEGPLQPKWPTWIFCYHLYLFPSAAPLFLEIHVTEWVLAVTGGSVQVCPALTDRIFCSQSMIFLTAFLATGLVCRLCHTMPKFTITMPISWRTRTEKRRP